MSITYPYDNSGVSPENLVKGELHSVNEAHFRDYYFLVPNFAPFFVDNFKAFITVNNETRQLVEDVDYSFALSYVTGTRVTGKQMYGAITLHNLQLNGIIRVEYQTIGGNHMADRYAVLTTLADKAYNPRTTIWDVVTDVPDALPPTPHYQDYDTFFGQDKVVAELHNIVEAIANNSSVTRETINEFLRSIGVDNLSNYLLLTGGQLQGPLFLQRDPQTAMEPVTKGYADLNLLTKVAYQQEASTFLKQEDLDYRLDTRLPLTGGRLTGFLTLNAAPQEDLHAATKYYVDNKTASLSQRIAALEQLNQDNMDGFVSREEVEKMIGEVMLRLLHKLPK